MVANCWLDKGDKAGLYPSGGPVSRMMEVWHFCAPAIDVIAPDIYVRNFCEVCDEYTRRGTPLLIPETATHSYAGPRLVYTIGHYHALGYAPFGFEEMGEPFNMQAGYLFGMDTSDPALGTPQNPEEYGWFGRTLISMMDLLASKYGTKDLQAVMCECKDGDTMTFGNYGFRAVMDSPIIPRKDGVCLALKVAEDTFYVIAHGCTLMPFSADTSKPHVDVLALEEGSFVDGKWEMLRRLNGDEVVLMNYLEPTLLKIQLHAFN